MKVYHEVIVKRMMKLKLEKVQRIFVFKIKVFYASPRKNKYAINKTGVCFSCDTWSIDLMDRFWTIMVRKLKKVRDLFLIVIFSKFGCSILLKQTSQATKNSWKNCQLLKKRNKFNWDWWWKRFCTQNSQSFFI